MDKKHIASALSGYEEQQWFKSKDKHNTALSQLQKIYNTVEERDAPTNIHGASCRCKLAMMQLLQKWSAHLPTTRQKIQPHKSQWKIY